MKILKSELQKIILEVTQGEMEFAELERARQDYLQDKNDETRYQFGVMVEKLVEPIMAELGLFFEAEAFYNRGEIVFSNMRDTEVTIDPEGMRGGYDVKVTPLPGAEDDVSPSEITLKSMKGVAQYVADLRNLDPEPAGMVGEPKAQTELPLENKMRITKSRLQKIIKEEIKRVLNEDNFDNVMRMAVKILGPDVTLDEEMDGNIVIVADEMDIEDNYGALMSAFPSGEMTEDGFATGVMG
tara:strand:+ start:739 stop:1461 length:723 start_codon:yes stop_codon:yes gene_type:complete